LDGPLLGLAGSSGSRRAGRNGKEVVLALLLGVDIVSACPLINVQNVEGETTGVYSSY